MTHNERVLRLLSDGKPHSHHEIYALYVVGHSRISDLRKQGYLIQQWRDGDDYLYQLHGSAGADGPVRENTGAALSSSDTPAAAPAFLPLPPEAGTPGQLTLIEVA